MVVSCVGSAEYPNLPNRSDVTISLHEDYDEFVPAADIRQYLDLPAEEFKAKVLELLQKWDPDVQPLSEWVAHLKGATGAGW